MIKSLTIYLAGSIRDKQGDDISWREQVINAIDDKAVIISPLGGKTYHNDTGLWTASGIVPDAKFLVSHDFWAVDHCDAGIFNFSALTEKYPNIGTLIEFGRSTARSMLRYVILDPSYKGHENEKLYHLHPFIEINATLVFPNVMECCDFLESHLQVLSGKEPRYRYDKEKV